jgi:hypothetical protein
MSPYRRRRRVRAFQITRFATLGAGVTASFVLDMTANKLSSLGHGLPWVFAAAGVLVFLGLWTLQQWEPGDDDDGPRPDVPLPHVDELIGRERTVERVVERARAHGVVVVHGPDGIGDSSVAITAARRLVPDQARQRYVDLRKVRPNHVWRARIPLLRESNRWVRMPVLRTFGLDLRMPDEEAGRAVADELWGSGLVLVIDNVSAANQVRWVAHGVAGAYIIIAGEIQVDELPGVVDVPVEGLAPADALDLLRNQDTGPSPGRIAKVWDRLWHGTRHPHVKDNSIDARIAAEREPAEELAQQYLQHPRIAIQLGRWLAQNPGEKISGLLRTLENLKEEPGNAPKLQWILGRALEGASSGARHLLAQLVTAPDVEFPDAAVAALAKIRAEEADARLTELGRRFLVHRSSSGARVARQAAGLTAPIPDREAAKVHIRLAAFYAKLAGANAELLGEQQYTKAARWFATHDVTLLGLLGMPSPPRRAASHLWRIAEALDLWFAREQRHRERLDVAEAMLARAGEVGDPAAQAVALIRMAATFRRRAHIGEARRLLNKAEALGHGRTPWRPQLKTGWALCHVVTGDLEAARNDVLSALRTRPQRDLEGRMTDLINLAVIEIRVRQDGVALDHLHAAVELAEEAGNIAGEAQGRELTGVALRSQGHTGAADHEWGEAERLYRMIGDDAGQSRCERHRKIEPSRPAR